MKPILKTISGQPSWRIATGEIEGFVTQTGGHLGPVNFHLGNRTIQPFSIAPWAEEDTGRSLPAILKVLRGDFFCMPFGGNATPFRGEQHPIHGETANARWRFEFAAEGCLHLSLATKIRQGRVDKYISMRPGERVVYQRHVITGMRGPMSFGHHAMLKFTGHPGSGRVSISGFRQGNVVPRPCEDPASGGYSCLKVGSKFKSLAKVPLAGGGFTDLSLYPARRGFEDLVMLSGDERLPFAWTAVAFAEERYVWLALKDPLVLRQTVLWLSNGGRHYPPWNGRHAGVLGLEEVTSYFHYGLAESAGKNPLAAAGRVTCHQLKPGTPLTINYIMAVAPIPKGFDAVAQVVPAADRKSVWLVSNAGKKVSVPVDLGFLTNEEADAKNRG